VRLSRRAAANPLDTAARSELQARVTHIYGLDEEDLVDVLATFPLVAEDERRGARDAFRRVRDEL
jgi:hypothetical protein